MKQITVLATVIAMVFLVTCKMGSSYPDYSKDNAQEDDTTKNNVVNPKPQTQAVGAHLLDAKHSQMNQTAPAKYSVELNTSKGVIVIDVTRALSPLGADRFYNLAKGGYFDDVRFFRMVRGFVVQFGMHGDPKVNKVWGEAPIKDEPVKMSNLHGTLTFATSGRHSRSNQLFINLANNRNLDRQGFTPFGKVVKGLNILNKMNYEYAQQPNQGMIAQQGNAYLKKSFPRLDYIKSTKVIDKK